MKEYKFFWRFTFESDATATVPGDNVLEAVANLVTTMPLENIVDVKRLRGVKHGNEVVRVPMDDKFEYNLYHEILEILQ